jgi:hypothetical protein
MPDTSINKPIDPADASYIVFLVRADSGETMRFLDRDELDE